MRIKLISNMYPSEKDSLFGVFVKKTVNALKGCGADFTQKIVIRGKRNNKIKKIFTYLSYYYKGIISILDKNYDLVYIHFLTHNIPLILIHKILQDKPLIINLHGSDIHQIKLNSKIDVWQERILYNVDAIVVPSLYFKKKLSKRYSSLSSNQIFIYPSGGLDLTIFKPERKINKKLMISFVSRIDEGKGWKDFLKIIESLNNSGINAKAIIAGDGKQRSNLINEINNHPFHEKIEYIGFQTKKELAKIYQSSEIFIFPTELPESLGLVGLEAMACGSVVFARNIGGPTGYINHNLNGYLFDNVNEAVQLIIDYIQLSNKEKNSIQNNALKTSKNYEEKKVALDLYTNFKNYA